VKRSLALQRETLTELTGDQLTTVVGAALPTSPVIDCLGISEEYSCIDCLTRFC
jgi:hypothetical protein